MKKGLIVLALTVFASFSSFADVIWSSKAGDIYSGTETVSGRPCTVEIVRLGKFKNGKLKIYVELFRQPYRISSVLSNAGHVFRGIEPGGQGQVLYSNLFVNTDGTPKTFDLSEYTTEETVMICTDLKKL